MSETRIESIKKELEEELKRTTRWIESLKEINKKANELYKEKDYSVFEEYELFLIADLSASKNLIIGREIRNGLKDLKELMDNVSK